MRNLSFLDLTDEPDRPWEDDALCAKTDPEAFFASSGAAKALAVCAQCPVRVECAEFAETHDERFGIWGGVVRGPMLA